MRERVEEAFSLYKGSLDGRKPRVWYPDSLRVRMFVQFFALGYLCYIKRRITEKRESLRKIEHEKTKEELNLERKLGEWLDAHSIAQIMDWFDCTETTKVTTEFANMRWTTESTARNKLLHKLLLTKFGVI